MSAGGFVEEEAVVVAVEGRTAWVEAQRQSTCGACAAAKGCGTATLGRVLGRRVNRVPALDTLGVRPGERVVVGLRAEALVRGSLLLYGVPLLGLIGLPLLVTVLWAPADGLAESWQAALALLGLGGGFLWVARRRGGLDKDPAMQAVILRRCPQGTNVAPVEFHNKKIGEQHG